MDVLRVFLLALSVTAPRPGLLELVVPSAFPENITHGSDGNMHAEPGLSREEPFRLVNNNSTCKGTVEVHYHGMWVPACGDSWSMKTSHAVCRQLNCGVAKWESAPAEKEPLYTFQSCPAINISCGELGSQEEHCLVQLSVSRTCCSGKLAHITCTGHRAVRLADGGSRCEGRVEVSEADVWGTVCDDAWDMVDADVVCKQLNCGWSIQAPGNSSFQKGTGPIHLDEVHCVGNESSLWDCLAERSHDCGHKEDAGVVCSEHQQWRLSGGKDHCAGQVEVYYKGSWNTVCDGTWYLEEQSVLCQSLGCGSPAKQLHFNHTLQGKMNYQCLGHEASLAQCIWHYNKMTVCHQSRAAGVICNGSMGLLDPFQPETMIPGGPRLPGTTTGYLNLEAKLPSHWTLLIIIIILGLILLITMLAFTAALLRMRKKHAHAVTSSLGGGPVLMNHSTQSQDMPAGASNDYRKIPTNVSRVQEMPAVPIPNAEDSDSDYEHYDFSSKPPMALSTFYNSLRRHPDEIQSGSSFPAAPNYEELNQNLQPQDWPPEPPAVLAPTWQTEGISSGLSTEANYCNSGNTTQLPWSTPTLPAAGSHLLLALPAQGTSGSQISFQAGTDNADSSSTSSGEWYENIQGKEHEGAQIGHAPSFPAWTAHSTPSGNHIPGGDSSSTDSDYDDIQTTTY
ncbi:T-cell differentiation antigen CD6 isoform B [Alligator mississippiensis]|uniref:T-cell differentiation antigen CD6 isoform B n=1 Tax=Alligator mississippiensis TaxID=8496 RepID=A0A151NXS4_ALLMI|nr:T-cell differentiation antigen CD6 isoform B [Alligator mississippiensis]